MAQTDSDKEEGTNMDISDSESECRKPGCTNPRGNQDRTDYRTRMFCSVQCDVSYDHVKSDARDAQRANGVDRGR